MASAAVFQELVSLIAEDPFNLASWKILRTRRLADAGLPPRILFRLYENYLQFFPTDVEMLLALLRMYHEQLSVDAADFSLVRTYAASTNALALWEYYTSRRFFAVARGAEGFLGEYHGAIEEAVAQTIYHPFFAHANIVNAFVDPKHLQADDFVQLCEIMATYPMSQQFLARPVVAEYARLLLLDEASPDEAGGAGAQADAQAEVHAEAKAKAAELAARLRRAKQTAEFTARFDAEQAAAWAGLYRAQASAAPTATAMVAAPAHGSPPSLPPVPAAPTGRNCDTTTPHYYPPTAHATRAFCDSQQYFVLLGNKLFDTELRLQSSICAHGLIPRVEVARRMLFALHQMTLHAPTPEVFMNILVFVRSLVAEYGLTSLACPAGGDPAAFINPFSQRLFALTRVDNVHQILLFYLYCALNQLIPMQTRISPTAVLCRLLAQCAETIDRFGLGSSPMYGNRYAFMTDYAMFVSPAVEPDRNEIAALIVFALDYFADQLPGGALCTTPGAGGGSGGSGSGNSGGNAGGPGAGAGDDPQDQPFLEDCFNRLYFGLFVYAVTSCNRYAVAAFVARTGTRFRDDLPLRLSALASLFDGLRRTYGVYLQVFCEFQQTSFKDARQAALAVLEKDGAAAAAAGDATGGAAGAETTADAVDGGLQAGLPARPQAFQTALAQSMSVAALDAALARFASLDIHIQGLVADAILHTARTLYGCTQRPDAVLAFLQPFFDGQLHCVSVGEDLRYRLLNAQCAGLTAFYLEMLYRARRFLLVASTLEDVLRECERVRFKSSSRTVAATHDGDNLVLNYSIALVSAFMHRLGPDASGPGAAAGAGTSELSADGQPALTAAPDTEYIVWSGLGGSGGPRALSAAALRGSSGGGGYNHNGHSSHSSHGSQSYGGDEGGAGRAGEAQADSAESSDTDTDASRGAGWDTAASYDLASVTSAPFIATLVTLLLLQNSGARKLHEQAEKASPALARCITVQDVARLAASLQDTLRDLRVLTTEASLFGPKAHMLNLGHFLRHLESISGARLVTRPELDLYNYTTSKEDAAKDAHGLGIARYYKVVVFDTLKASLSLDATRGLDFAALDTLYPWSNVIMDRNGELRSSGHRTVSDGLLDLLARRTDGGEMLLRRFLSML